MMFFKSIYSIGQPLLKFFYFIFFFFRAKGRNNVPKESGVLICGNHKSNHDGILVGAYTRRRLTFIVKKEVFQNPIANWFLQGLGLKPVDRNGSDVTLIKTALSVLKNGGGLVIFPEGTRYSKDISESKDGAVVLALKTHVPIVPVHIISTYKLFSKSEIIYGEPFDLSEYYDKKLTQEQIHAITIELMKKIYSLGEDK